jgi:hypothetical protein
MYRVPIKYSQVCTRHHCIDWNYVGTPRPRPNKWWVEMHPDKDIWKEWAYATDDHGQHYYMERWERLDAGTPTEQLALRRQQGGGDGWNFGCGSGDRFNYLLNRCLLGNREPIWTNNPS